MLVSYYVICSNALPQNAGKIDSKFCPNGDALYETLLQLKPNKSLDINFENVSKDELLAFIERVKVVQLDSAEYRTITVLHHAPEKTTMFVSLTVTEYKFLDGICPIPDGQKWCEDLSEAKRINDPHQSAHNSEQWSWMMNYCKNRGVSPTLGWDSAKKAWEEHLKQQI